MNRVTEQFHFSISFEPFPFWNGPHDPVKVRSSLRDEQTRELLAIEPIWCQHLQVFSSVFASLQTRKELFAVDEL